MFFKGLDTSAAKQGKPSGPPSSALLRNAELGGAGRDRTDDLKLAKLPLSQLSYGPLSIRMVGPGRLELPTLRLSGVRSNHLSYGPPLDHARVAGSSPGRTLRTTKCPRADAGVCAPQEQWVGNRTNMTGTREPAPTQDARLGGHLKCQLPDTKPNESSLRNPLVSLVRKLLRKEVIQPHLPIRLPCYDLAPIRNLALDA